MLNEVTLIGNLTRDPEVKTIPGGAEVGNFSIAVNEVYIDPAGVQRESVLFMDCTVWKQGIRQIQPLRQGDRVFVRGKLVMNRWEDANGQKRSAIKLTAFRVIHMPRAERVPSAEDVGFATQEDPVVLPAQTVAPTAPAPTPARAKPTGRGRKPAQPEPLAVTNGIHDEIPF